MALKQRLDIKLQQKLTPLQIQVIKLLEYPTDELDMRVREELEANPALDEGNDQDDLQTEDNNDDYGNEAEKDDTNDDFDLSEFLNDDDEIPEYRLKANNRSDEDQQEAIPIAGGISFHENLISQLDLCEMPADIKPLAEYLIGNIDDDGYLRRDIESMLDDIAFQTGTYIEQDKMEKALNIVQSLDPAGVGARNLQECLMLQLKRIKETPDIINAKTIIEQYFVLFSKKQYENIIRRMNVSEDEVKRAISLILRLNPKPGNAFGGNTASVTVHITPDFYVANENGTLKVMLNNSNIPELRINPSYNNMVKDFVSNKNNQTRATKDALTFAKQKIDAARWFIDAIKQRNNTLLMTMNAIVKAQYEFFLDGDESKLRPMKLKDIAEKVGFDISTISRVSNSKYVQTDFGIFPLKYFFSESMKTDSGKEISNKEIKQIIQQVIEEENKQNPISDDAITDSLKEKGYIIARRTVAKYREQLRIPVARLRKTHM